MQQFSAEKHRSATFARKGVNATLEAGKPRGMTPVGAACRRSFNFPPVLWRGQCRKYPKLHRFYLFCRIGVPYFWMSPHCHGRGRVGGRSSLSIWNREGWRGSKGKRAGNWSGNGAEIGRGEVEKRGWKWVWERSGNGAGICWDSIVEIKF